jgi:hypothetical protein
VTGLEPGVCYCYPRAVERAAGRVPTLPPGGEASYRLEWRVLRDAAAVEETEREIEEIQAGRLPKVHEWPALDPRA